MAYISSSRTVMSPLIYGERKRSGNMQQRRLQLEKEVADLKKTLEDEKKVHEILERALVPNSFQFMRHIPNFLPNKTKELLAELVLVEEEVARLEDQIHKIQGGLREIKPTSVPVQDSVRYNKTYQEMQDKLPKEMKAMFFINRAIKEEHLSHNLVESKGRKSVENNSPRFLEHKEPTDLHADKLVKVFQEPLSKKIDSGKLSLQPNKLSERILKCLICIFQRLLRTSRVAEQEKTSNISRTSGSIFDAVNTNLRKGQQDPYGIFEIEESIRRDIGSYKNLVRFSRSSLDTKLLSTSFPLFNKLRELMDALQLVDLHVLTHNQKLAFWINVYNACIMNGFLQNGLPSNSERILMIKNKSLVNVGGIKLTPIEIEHSIMQHPSKVNNSQTGNLNSEQEILVKNSYGLEKEEPNIIFALCCGTKSSPALRIYTPDRISADLEKSKLDYLQAALVVTATKRLLIPSLIHSNFMYKFEKDLEPLMQWILNQLSTSWPLRKSMVECLKLQTGIKINGFVEIMPYNDEFQYLFPV
ncbi:Rho GTPase-activating protein 7 [Carex littledalei]|uniref:Rho GTPase-activating protein 7 n=1 Tax=Carex littledalei TaxID=544730 RepID=A0A833R938_9POAL|nr:Rho GTPase-activating protein 7 [Carex littledalei]